MLSSEKACLQGMVRQVQCDGMVAREDPVWCLYRMPMPRAVQLCEVMRRWYRRYCTR